jgi:hypothetical protein
MLHISDLKHMVIVMVAVVVMVVVVVVDVLTCELVEGM